MPVPSESVDAWLEDAALLSGIQRARVALPDGSIVAAATAFVDYFVLEPTGWRLRHATSFELGGTGSSAGPG